MDIIPYTKLREKHRMLPLFHHAGHSPFDYRRRGQGDYRIKEGYEGFCAVEGDELLGFAGLMEIPTQTVSGSEAAGGIWGVVTDYTSGRRGVSTALMEASHQYFRERGFSFVFLTTYRSMVAHQLYRKLGYNDVDAVSKYPTAYCLVEPHETALDSNVTTPDEDSVARLFAEFTSGYTGFVIRPKDYLRYVMGRGSVNPDLSIQVEGGYALVAKRLELIQIREIVARDPRVQAKLLRALERKSRGGAVIDPVVTIKGLMEGYVARNYHTYRGRYNVVMVKALKRDISFEEAYGDTFFISSLEWF